MRLISLALVLEFLQVIVFLSVVFSYFPVNKYPFINELFERDKPGNFNPDWQILIYRLSLLITLFLAWRLIVIFKEQLEKPAWVKHLRHYMIGSALLLLIQYTAAFYLFTKMPTATTKTVLYIGLMGAVLMRLFWDEITKCINKILPNPLAVKIFWLTVASLLAIAFYGAGGLAGLAIEMMIIIALVLLGVLIWFVLQWLKSDVPLPLPTWCTPIIKTIVWACRQPLLRSSSGVLFIVVMLAIIWPIDPQAAIAKNAFGEHFYHYDISLMAGAYVSGSGNRLGVDQIAQYGLGMPGMVAAAAKLFFGQVNYLSVFITYISICCLYFILFYIFLWRWSNSVLLSMAAIFLAIKWQLFYTLSYPMTFFYPSATVLRCLFDLPLFLLLVLHYQTNRWIYLGIAGALVGWGFYYVPTTGIDLLVAFGAYLLVTKLMQGQWKQTLAWGVWPLLCGFLFFWIMCGNHVWQKIFWQDLIEYPYLFITGFYRIPFWQTLETKYYWDFIFACIMPLVYLFTLIWTGIRCLLKKATLQEVMIFCVCCYGLSLFHHFISLGVRNNYYMRAIPWVVVLFYWLNLGMAHWVSPRRKLLVAWLIWGACLAALVTNHWYRAHPNILNPVRNPLVNPKTAYPLPEDGRPYFFHTDGWYPEQDKFAVNSLGSTDERVFSEFQIPDHDTLKQLYAQEFDFSQDAALIKSLTGVKEKVALISSFEVEILIQSQRRPFFFQFPLLVARGMNLRTFPHTSMIYMRSLNRTLADLEKYKPTYVFMERIYLNRTIPERYFRTEEELLQLLSYVHEHYQPGQVGKYLIAMKRKENQ